MRVPAHYCGVAALKPTAGRVPNTGVYNHPGGLSDPITQLGPVARYVDDLALLLPLLAGPDGADSGVAPVAHRDFSTVRPSELTVAHFGQENGSPVSDETVHAVGAASQALARAGVQIEQAHPRDMVRDARVIHDAWQAISGSPGQDVVETFTAWDYLRSSFLRFLDDYDALLCPADHHAAPPFRAQDPQRFDYAIPFSMTGNPCVVVRVRAGKDGLPIGVQVVARPWREDVALALAKVLESELGGWQRPPL
ncbi:MAG: hypothetical protein HC802_17680 [Caldilineaceae bacterium]|nr:hypothetical protein [Caldilineaceae bacterium]